MNVALRANRTGNYISICTGGYGLDLGVDLATGGATRAVCLVENEATAGALLVDHMEAGWIHPAPLWSDLRTFDFGAWRGHVQGLVGGYPCQPFSNAGKRLGADDPRHLWPVIAAGIRELEPEWCIFENVGAHLRLGFYEVARELQGMGYRVAGVLLTAEEVGAPHGRERLFIMADRQCTGLEGATWGGLDSARWSGREPSPHGAGMADPEHTERWAPAEGRDVTDGHDPGWHQASGWAAQRSGELLADPSSLSGHVPPSGRADGASGGTVASAGRDGHAQELADTERGSGSPEPRLEHQERAEASHRPSDWPPRPDDTDAWGRILAVRPDLAPAVEPPVRGVVDGVAGGMDLARSDQLHILGNGVVPPQAAYAWSLLADALDG